MNKKSITFLILELIFMVVAPIITIFAFYPTFVQSRQLTVNRVNIGIIISLLLLWIVIKKTLLARRITKVESMTTQLEADLRVEPQGEKRNNIVSSLKTLKTERCVMSAVMPLLLFILAVTITTGLVQVVTSIQASANNFFNALKDELSKYALCVFIITLQYTTSTIFNVLYERATVR